MKKHTFRLTPPIDRTTTNLLADATTQLYSLYEKTKEKVQKQIQVIIDRKLLGPFQVEKSANRENWELQTSL